MKKTKTFYRVGVLCLCTLFILSYHIPLGRAQTYLDYLDDKIQNGYDIDTFSDTSDLINYEVDRMNQLQDLINTSITTSGTFSGSTLQNTTTGTGTGTGGGVTTLGSPPPAPAILGAPVTMPTMPATATTDGNGVAVITYTAGTILPTDLNDLWARVKYDGKTEYWDLDPSMLSPTGTFLTIQFNSTFNTKTVEMEFYGFDTTGAPTGFSNKVTIGPITSAPSTVVMPTLPTPVTTDPNGKITAVFTSGTLFGTQLQDLWARVKYDGKTEYWDLDKSMLAADGLSFTMQFNSTFDGKTVEMELYGYDTSGKQTTFTNIMNVVVNSAASSVVMPTLVAGPLTTDGVGKINIGFSAGSLFYTQLNDLWARVKYDGKTEYWDLDPSMLAANGLSVNMQFNSAFDNKIVSIEFYGYDTTGKQTSFTNSVNIDVDSSPSTVTMPTVPGSQTTSANGQITITFTSGTLQPTQVNDLWARVTYDGKTEYWDLDKTMLAADGHSLTMQFNSSFHGKVVKTEFYAFDTLGKQTDFMNAINITVDSSPSTVVMPTLPASQTTDPNGKITIVFTAGTLPPASITDLWARVNYDGKTEYWDLTTALLSPGGTSLTMQFNATFHGKVVKLEFYGYDGAGKQTAFTNPINVTVDSAPSTVTMPVLPAGPVNTDGNGKVTLTFASGTLLPTSITDLWARVEYDGTIEYWDLDPGMLNALGTTFSMQFSSAFHGKTVKLELFAYDPGGKQTLFTNSINIVVNSSPSGVSMPTLPVSATTDPNGKVTLVFTSGTLLPANITDLWARVEYDGKTEYWDLDKTMLSAGGTSFTMQFNSSFHGKTVNLQLYAYDTPGKQTAFSTQTQITVDSSPSAVVMPTLPGTGTTDPNGKITVTFASGTLLPTSLTDLWAKVSYDGKTEYWDLDTGMLNVAGTQFSIQFTSAFHGKIVKLELFGYDTAGKQTLNTNAINITVNSSPSTIVMPTLPATGNTDANGKIVIALTGGTFTPANLTDVWARVQYDGKTEYWDLSTALLAVDGSTLTIQFNNSFHGKHVVMEFYGFDLLGKQTAFMTPIDITVDSSPSTVTMPVLPGTGATDVNGKLSVTFVSGTLLPASLNGFWARVQYDGKTEYWDLGTAVLAADGHSLSMLFTPAFDNKTVKLEFFGYDAVGKQTLFTNQISVTVDSNLSPLAMPTLPGTGTTDANGKITVTFSAGTLLRTSLTDLWARVTYDLGGGAVTEFWDLDPSMLSVSGNSFTIQFNNTFHGKVVKLELFGFDTIGKQTNFTNFINITVNSSPSAVVMPTLPATGTTDGNGKIVITYASGTLIYSQLNDLWARVTYDGKTEYWDLDPAMLTTPNTFTMQFGSAFHGKVVKVELFGYDTVGKQTTFTNGIDITVNSSPSAVLMPTLPGTGTTDANGKIIVTFAAGTLVPTSLNDLWAKVQYDGKTEYWNLDPSMLNATGTTFTIQFGSSFHGKVVKLELYGYDTGGKQTLLSNAIDITVNSSPSTLVMPTLPNLQTTNPNGKITINFTSGTLLAANITDLWARVNYDGKTEYWDLDPAMLSVSGTAFTMQFSSAFHGKTVKLELFAYDTVGKQTSFTNPITITVDSSPSTVLMPTLPAGPASTDVNGKITLTFIGLPVLLPTSINDLWARVQYDGKTEYWDLDPAMLNASGTNFTMQFNSTFHGKVVKIELFGYDSLGKQTAYSNQSIINVDSSASGVIMPTLPSGPTATDVNGKVTLTFTAGTLLPTSITDLWARVQYDGKTEYWDLDPSMLNALGTTFTMQFGSTFHGKTVKLELFGYDTIGKQTLLSNQTTITVNSSPSAVTMPALPAGPTNTDSNGKITLTFTAGTLLRTSITDLWARVVYDGKTEYWDLDPTMLNVAGTQFAIQFSSAFHGKTIKLELFGYDTVGKQTLFTNQTIIIVNSSASAVTPPTLPAGPVTTDPNGKITLTLTGAGTFKPANLNDLWARVKYDGKTEYWDLDTAMLNTAGTQFTMQFDSTFHGKAVQIELFGYDTLGKQTLLSNQTTINVDSSPSTVLMPTLPSGPATTNTTGKITLTFTAGTLVPTSLNDLWARVQYDGKTEYWDLDPALLNTAGTQFTIQFNSTFHGKTVKLELYGFDTLGKQTLLSNQTTINVDSSASGVIMPTLPGTGSTDGVGKITVTFTGPVLLPRASINDLWARVTYDGKVEYWDLDPSMLSEIGDTFSIQFSSSFNAKTVKMELFAYDTAGKQTLFSNPINITVTSQASTVVMPTLPGTSGTADNGKVTLYFVSGTLTPSQLKELWARVTYDGKIEYWKLDPGMLSAGGSSITMQFDNSFNGKTVKVELYGYDTSDRQTTFTNAVNIVVTSLPPIVTMPVILGTGTTNAGGAIQVTFTSGTLFAAQLNDLWARVRYDGKTEYWDLDPGMLAADGLSLYMQFDPAFHGKTVIMEFYGYDTLGRQTAFTNTITITVL